MSPPQVSPASGLRFAYTKSKEFVRKKVRSLQELQDQLGVRQNAVGQRTFDKKDPKCRFV